MSSVPLSVGAATGASTASAEIVNHIAVRYSTIFALEDFYSDNPVVVGIAEQRSVSSDLSATVAEFTVAGDPVTNFFVTLPNELRVADTQGNTLTLSGFTRVRGTLGRSVRGGTRSFTIGATLPGEARSRRGAYSGTIQVGLDYY